MGWGEMERRKMERRMRQARRFWWNITEDHKLYAVVVFMMGVLVWFGLDYLEALFR